MKKLCPGSHCARDFATNSCRFCLRGLIKDQLVYGYVVKNHYIDLDLYNVIQVKLVMGIIEPPGYRYNYSGFNYDELVSKNIRYTNK